LAIRKLEGIHLDWIARASNQFVHQTNNHSSFFVCFYYGRHLRFWHRPISRVMESSSQKYMWPLFWEFRHV